MTAWISWLLVGLSAFSAQEADANLYTRVEGDYVRLAIEVEVSPDWHLYHTDLGDPNAIGKPLSIEFEGPGISWEPAVLPEPEVHEDEDLDVWANVHTGTFVIHGAGRMGADSDASAIRVKLDGLTCSDVTGTCIPYSQTLEPKGKGRDDLFANFPAQLEPQKKATLANPPLLLRGPFGGSAKKAGHASAELFLRADGGTIRGVIEVSVDEGWYLYHTDLGDPDAIGKALEINLEGDGVEWSEPTLPEPDVHLDEDFPPTNIHYGDFTILIEGKGAAAPEDIEVELDGLTCSDADGQCVVFQATLKSSGTGTDAAFAAFSAAALEAGSDATGTAGSSENDLDGMPLSQFLLLAFFWGLITLLMPCTYPMIPITISFFTKQAIERKGKVLPLSLAYGAGIVAIFIVIGVVLGPPIIAFATNPWTNIIIGAMFVFFALALFGAINLQPPAFLMNAASKASTTGGLLGVFLMGLTLVVTSFTCTAPFVGSLLSVGATGGTGITRIVLGMGVFGLTMATPFVFLSLVPGKIQTMPKAGEWMHVLKVFLGFVELAAALKFISNADLVWNWGLLSREVFLVLWVGIFFVAGAFLLGWIKLKDEAHDGIAPVRMVGGLASFLFALYCSLGVMGFVMDDTMTAIIPPYSHPRLGAATTGPGSGHGSTPGSHTIVIDDYELARDTAISEDKLLLVNFTGLT